MKRTILFFLLVLSLFITSCEKESDIFLSSRKYELRFTSTSRNPYLIEVNGNSDIIPGNTYKSYKFKKGSYSWRVEQQSGYLLYPTIREGTVNLNEDKEIVFP